MRFRRMLKCQLSLETRFLIYTKYSNMKARFVPPLFDLQLCFTIPSRLLLVFFLSVVSKYIHQVLGSNTYYHYFTCSYN